MIFDIFSKINSFLENFSIDTYFLFIMIGILLMINFIIVTLEKKNGYSRKYTNKILIVVSISLVMAYVSAAFFDALFHYFKNGIFEGGVTYISGFIGGIITFILLMKVYLKEPNNKILIILNLIIPSVVLAHAFGRIGCFSVGSCYGKPTDSIFGVFFSEGTNPYIEGIRVPVHPTQLYESIFLFGLFAFLNYYKKIKHYRLFIYLTFYGVFRFFIEMFLRGDNRGLLFGFPPSLVLSAVMVLTGLLFIFIKRVKPSSFEQI